MKWHCNHPGRINLRIAFSLLVPSMRPERFKWAWLTVTDSADPTVLLCSLKFDIRVSVNRKTTHIISGSFIINETFVGVQVLRGSTMGHNGALRVILRWLLSQALSRSVILERAYKKVENVWGSILAMASHSGKHADLGILTPLTVI